MIEKLKIEPYIKESLYAHLYALDGKLVVERYDTIYWIKEKFFNVGATLNLDVYVDAKKFCDLASSLKSVELISAEKVNLVLFNGAKYELDALNPEVTICQYKFPDLPNTSVFEFGGVEKAVSKSPLQKELNTVYADHDGIVASSSIVGGVSNGGAVTFASLIPFAVPEGVHSLFSGEQVEWGIFDNSLFVKFNNIEFVAVLPKLSEFDWWNAVRSSFDGVDFESGSKIKGLRSSLGRLSGFGARVTISDGVIAVDEQHWEPIALSGSGEAFDIADLLQVATDDETVAVLSGGNLYLRTPGVDFVVCSVDVVSA